MRKFLILLVAGFVISVGGKLSATERTGDQGFGLMLGNPTGISAKYWLNNKWGIDGAAGVISGDLDIHSNVLFHNFNWYKNMDKWGWFESMTNKGELPFYFGGGFRLLFKDDTEMGIRIPLGLSYLLNDSNWEFFTEFAPVFRLTPSTGFNGDFAIGFRYYFKAIQPKT